MRAFILPGVVVLAAMTLPSCAAKVQARAEVELPLLSPPPPPPRVVAAYPEEPEPVAPAVDEPVAPARPPSRPARPEPPRAETPRPEPVKPAPPSLTLSPGAGTEAQTEAAIRALLGRAARDLSRANPGSLNNDQRAQFDTARRFLQQAEEALKARNLVYAGKLADKAATLAAVFAR
jgi:hypothetical protein